MVKTDLLRLSETAFLAAGSVLGASASQSFFERSLPR